MLPFFWIWRRRRIFFTIKIILPANLCSILTVPLFFHRIATIALLCCHEWIWKIEKLHVGVWVMLSLNHPRRNFGCIGGNQWPICSSTTSYSFSYVWPCSCPKVGNLKKVASLAVLWSMIFTAIRVWGYHLGYGSVCPHISLRCLPRFFAPHFPWLLRWELRPIFSSQFFVVLFIGFGVKCSISCWISILSDVDFDVNLLYQISIDYVIASLNTCILHGDPSEWLNSITT